VKTWAYRLGLVVLLVAICGVGGIWAYARYYHERVLPGVTVADIDVGGMTRAEAEAQLRRSLPDPQDETIVLRAGEHQLRFSWAALGKGFDTALTVDAAYAQGREGAGLARWLQPLRVRFAGRVVAPVTVPADPARVRAAVERLAAQVEVAPEDAQLEITPAGARGLPGKVGRRLDVDAGIDAVQAALAADQPSVELPVVELPPQLAEPEPARSQAQALLAQPFVVNVNDPLTEYTATFSAPPEIVATWLDARPAYPARMILAFKQSEIRRWLMQEIEPQLGDERYDIAYNHGFPQWRLEEANPEIEPGNLLIGQELVIPSIDVLISEPIVPDKRIEISLPEQTLRAYERDELRFELRASSGMSTTPTIAGQFQVLMKEPDAYARRWDLEMPYFMGIYKEGPNFYNGIHELPILASGRRLSAGVLGWPASYGCIILDEEDAETLFDWAPIGTLVRITGVAPGTPSAVETLDEAVNAEP
jgi:lipoprotein-anchoring transpeptidase ErfK/SrfK